MAFFACARTLVRIKCIHVKCGGVGVCSWRRSSTWISIISAHCAHHTPIRFAHWRCVWILAMARAPRTTRAFVMQSIENSIKFRCRFVALHSTVSSSHLTAEHYFPMRHSLLFALFLPIFTLMSVQYCKLNPNPIQNPFANTFLCAVWIRGIVGLLAAAAAVGWCCYCCEIACFGALRTCARTPARPYNNVSYFIFLPFYFLST